VADKPKPGKEAELHALAVEHLPFPRSLGLVTNRPHAMATADGTIVEVFEWIDGGIGRA
jgi:hypothetical protein